MPEDVAPPAGRRTAAPPVVRGVLARGADQLAAAGCETPRLDAELLLCAALGPGWGRTRLVTDGAAAVGTDTTERYRALLARRSEREPVAYILGVKDFRLLTLAVDHRVLIPRPETELLVEVGLTLPDGARVADVGTGSGAVALALKHERPDLEVTGLDISAGALEVARGNAARLGLDVTFARADLLDHPDGYDGVLANLPYVPAGTPDLAPEILRYEPPGALFGGADGLDVVRRLIEQLGDAGAPALVALEVGAGQAPSVEGLVRAAGFGSITLVEDLAGHERVVVGRR